MEGYKIGSLGDLISGNSNGLANTKKIIFKELTPRPKNNTSSDEQPSSKLKGKSDVFTELKKGLKIKDKIRSTISRKRKAEIAGDDVSDTVGVSYSLHNSEDYVPLNNSEEHSKAGEDNPQDQDTFKRNAARRVHIKNNTRKHVDNSEKNSRTIFVGNIPYAHSDKKKLIKFFSKYGEVESVRIRCAPLNDPRVSKKVAVIKHKFHPERSSINGYVVFKNSENAESALEANGSVFHDHHLRVDSASAKPQVDPKKCVFLGNVPFVTEEEDLWQLFAECGPIESVRIVRDPITSVSKGIAFVNFTTSDAAELALHLNGSVLKKRTISVTRAKPSAKSTLAKPLSAKPVRHVRTDAKAKPKISANEEKRMAKKAKRKMRREGEAALGIQRKKKKKNDASEEMGKQTVVKPNVGGTETEEASSGSVVKEGKKNKHLRFQEQSEEASNESKGKEAKKNKHTRFQGQTVEESKKKKRKINKGAQRKKKIALLLSGGKKKT